MFRIALVIPPGLPGTTPNREGASGLGAVEETVGGFRYAPHTVALCGATLREAGYDVVAIDAPALGYDVGACTAVVRASDPDLVAVFVSWATREADARFLAAWRDAPGVGVPVVAFGISTAWMPEALRDADHVLLGEPEGALPSLCRALLAEGSAVPRDVPPQSLTVSGYTFAGFICDLEVLPIPAWDLLPMERYNHLSVLSSRGCTATCRWCPYVVAQGGGHRTVSPARTLQELRALIATYAPQRIIFRDPVFAHDRDRAASLCRLILRDDVLRPGVNLKWECESRPEHLDRSLMRLMSLAGCIGIKIGLESTDAALLARQGRIASKEGAPAYLNQVATVIRSCRRFDIACRLYAMVGLPGQTVEMAHETARRVMAWRPTSLTTKSLIAYPGLRLALAEQPSQEDVAAQTAELEKARLALAAVAPTPSSRWRRVTRGLLRRILVVHRWGGG
jgi:anaerobic magnesium-protoporphyrin IX monomethyl ester cyclase